MIAYRIGTYVYGLERSTDYKIPADSLTSARSSPSLRWSTPQPQHLSFFQDALLLPFEQPQTLDRPILPSLVPMLLGDEPTDLDKLIRKFRDTKGREGEIGEQIANQFKVSVEETREGEGDGRMRGGWERDRGLRCGSEGSKGAGERSESREESCDQ